LIPFLIEAKKQGICHCPAPIEELRHWLMIQIFNLSRRQYASAGEARRVVRTYVLPVLALEQPTPAISEKIDFIYRYIQDCLPR
jgi:hypothetical protein